MVTSCNTSKIRTIEISGSVYAYQTLFLKIYELINTVPVCKSYLSIKFINLLYGCQKLLIVNR